MRVRAAGVNPGDWRLREGSYGPAAPAVLGREVAGTVAALGPAVSGFAVGDEVFGGCPDMQGGFAPLARVTAGFAAPRPSAVSPSDAAVLPVAAGTAYDALTALDLPPGATLLVNGAGGGVGLPVVQLARARGLRVIGTASPAKHALLARLGAEPVAYGEGVARAGAGGRAGRRRRGVRPGRRRRAAGRRGAGRPEAAALGGRQAARPGAGRRRGAARPQHRRAHRARPAGGGGRARPARQRGAPVRGGTGRDARGGERSRARQSHHPPVSELRWTP